MWLPRSLAEAHLLHRKQLLFLPRSRAGEAGFVLCGPATLKQGLLAAWRLGLVGCYEPGKRGLVYNRCALRNY